MKRPSPRAARALAFAALLVAFATAGCEKKPAASAVKPEHQQLVDVLEIAQEKRVELATARVRIRRVAADLAAKKEYLAADLKKIDADLSEMAQKLKAAKAAAAANGTDVKVAHEGIEFSENNFRSLFSQKLALQKNSSKRSVLFNTLYSTHDEELQKVSLALNTLDNEEKMAKDNIDDLLLGREIKGVGEILERMNALNVAQITNAALELEKKVSLGDVSGITASGAALTSAQNAEIDSLLK
jgi:hypothetical protein